jgi:arylsulfatase A-like enzyme
MGITAGSLNAAEKPNVVIIYGDDVGYADIGAYGAKLIPTPNIDKLAKESLMFTDGHCSAATCTPSRFSLLTGIQAFRHGVAVLPPNAPMEIKPNMPTMPQMFKDAGYQTAVIGKWHLGLGKSGKRNNWNGLITPSPNQIGFDFSFLLPYTNDRVPCVYLKNGRVVNLDPSDPIYVGRKPKGVKCTVYPDARKNPEAMTFYKSTHGHNNTVINGVGRIGYMWGGKSALWNDETMTDEFVKQTREFLKNRDKNKPVFLYFASQCIHVPRVPNPRFRGKSKLSYRGDSMVEFDWATGEIMKMLKDFGMDENTIVIWSSDNGPVYDDGYEDGTTVRTSTRESDRRHDASGPYRGGKYQIYEGGTRVPFIVRWPGKIKPGKTDALFNQIDLLATFAALLNIKLEPNQAVDSRNALPALLGKDKKGQSYTIEEAGRFIALRQDYWKYITPVGKKNKGKEQLYNLKTDIGEKHNVAAQYPEISKQMHDLLMKLFHSEAGLRKESE